MAAKVDRRVRKTKAQLREGLAHLMLEKSIKEITVKELVDKVDINRSTFIFITQIFIRCFRRLKKKHWKTSPVC